MSCLSDPGGVHSHSSPDRAGIAGGGHGQHGDTDAEISQGAGPQSARCLSEGEAVGGSLSTGLCLDKCCSGLKLEVWSNADA